MTTIWKYELKITDYQEIEMPFREPQILSAGLDPKGVPCLWAMVLPGEGKWKVSVRIVGTGNPVDEVVGWKFVNSFVDGPFVWHVFYHL
jgi:hypothetical protein